MDSQKSHCNGLKALWTGKSTWLPVQLILSWITMENHKLWNVFSKTHDRLLLIYMHGFTWWTCEYKSIENEIAIYISTSLFKVFYNPWKKQHNILVTLYLKPLCIMHYKALLKGIMHIIIHNAHCHTVSHRSEYTPHSFVNILLYILMWQHWRNYTLLQCKVVSVQLV